MSYRNHTDENPAEEQRSASVFDRTEANSADRIVSNGVYNLVIGLVLCWGFLVNWLIVRYVPYATLKSINPILFLIGYFACCFLGVFLFRRSENPIVSFVGYNLVVLPFGAMVNLVVHHYDPSVVAEAMKVAGVVTGTMMLLGALFPKLFQRMAAILAISLLLVVIWELTDVLILGTHHGVIDWIVAIIFCGYIGVDWGRATRIPKTVDNAVDSAAALYMDIINLFIRILRIMGRKK